MFGITRIGHGTEKSRKASDAPDIFRRTCAFSVNASRIHDAWLRFGDGFQKDGMNPAISEIVFVFESQLSSMVRNELTDSHKLTVLGILIQFTMLIPRIEVFDSGNLKHIQVRVGPSHSRLNQAVQPRKSDILRFDSAPDSGYAVPKNDLAEQSVCRSILESALAPSESRWTLEYPGASE